MPVADDLTKGRDAFDRREWATAVEALTEADGEQPLGPDDLHRLADAAWWDARPELSVDALERAFAAYLEAGDRTSAAVVGAQLAYLAFRRMAVSIAAGWLRQVERLVQDEPPSQAHAWLKLLQSAEAQFIRRDFDAAVALADEAIEISRRVEAADPRVMSQSNKGYMLVARGDWDSGLALIDESTASAVSGQLGLRVASDVYCNTISACRSTADYQRAAEWTEEADRWMRRHSIGGYPGVCRVHRAEVKKLKGSWPEAEREARRACEELETFGLLDVVGDAHYEIGETRLRMGDLEGAEAAFEKAYEWGGPTQPGMALLLLAKGDPEVAGESIARGLAVRGGDDADAARSLLDRAALLPAQVKIAAALGDRHRARAATEDLERLADRFDRPVFGAAAATARGTVALLEESFEEAVPNLDAAWRQWRQIGFPYEAAEARTLLGRAHAAGGDDEAARRDIKAARSAFADLGAARDVAALDELLGETPALDTHRRRVIKTFMFTDIVTSTDLVNVIGDAAWEELLHWHDSALTSAFAAHRGDVVRHTGDGFFVAFDRASDAVECAVAIQRRLVEHRREHGFAPWVRIGFHTAEATPMGSDYAGHDVHVAARVAALAESEQIVASAAAVESAGVIRFAVSPGRQVTLKGVPEPVEVFTIDWR